MGSDAILAETALLVAAASGIFAGLAAAAGARYAWRRTHGAGAGGCTAAMVFASVFVAGAAWVFLAVTRGRAGTEGLAAYAGAGFAAGIASGVFPRAIGAPLVALAAFAAMLAVAAFSPWVPWTDGEQAARLSTFPVHATSTVVTLRLQSPRGAELERVIELPPGQIRASFEVVDFAGPLVAAFGQRRYQLRALSAGDASITVTDDWSLGGFRLADSVFATLAGARLRAVDTGLITPENFASAVFTLEADGSIRVSTR